MTSPKEIEHYQEQIKTLLDAKKRRLDELKEINDRLAVMGVKSTPKKLVSKHTTSKTVPGKTVPDKTMPGKTVPGKTATSKPKTDTIKMSGQGSGKKVSEPNINATVKNMKLFLDFRGIPYGSHANRSEIEQIVRKHNLVRKVVAFQKA